MTESVDVDMEEDWGDFNLVLAEDFDPCDAVIQSRLNNEQNLKTLIQEVNGLHTQPHLLY